MTFDLSEIKKTMHKPFRKQLEQATSYIEFAVCIQLFRSIQSRVHFLRKTSRYILYELFWLAHNGV